MLQRTDAILKRLCSQTTVVDESILVDTGPIVAALVMGDEHHTWSAGIWRNLEPPLFTCEAVLSEAQFVVERLGGNSLAVLEFIGRGILKIDFCATQEIERLLQLQTTYHNLPMSFADACLVRMAERHSHSRVFTTDSDFRIYRRNGRQIIPLLAPPA